MDTRSTIATSREGWNSEDALEVLGRVADAFDDPSLHKTDKELKLFVVNVVKSRHLLTRFSGEESARQCGAGLGLHDSSLDVACDGDVCVWGQATSYPHTSRRRPSHQRRRRSAKALEQDDGTYDVIQMLLTSSPLDRLDRLARMELKKTGWVERADKWTIVEMGLQGAPPPVTPPKGPSKKADPKIGESGERPSPTKTSSPNDGRQVHHTPRRPGTGGGQPSSRRARGHDTPEYRADTIKCTPPRTMRSPAHSQASRPQLADVFAPAQANAPKLSGTDSTTTIRASRLSRAPLLRPQESREQTRGRLGRVVRNIVKRMLPPPSVGRHTVKGTPGDPLATRAFEVAMTPRSDMSAESGWSFASVNSWKETRAQGCLDYQATNRWSGFWL